MIKIYCLKDPITNEIRYIGKTSIALHKRLSAHCKDKKPSYKKNWITSLKRKGLKPVIEIIEIAKEDNWAERERYWINFYKEKNYKITNISLGGTGLGHGYKHSPEAIEKIRAASLKGNSGQFKVGIKSKEFEQNRLKIVQRKVLKYSLEGIFIEEYVSIKEAANINCMSESNIGYSIKNLGSAKGYMWRYYTDNYPKVIEKYKRKTRYDKNNNN